MNQVNPEQKDALTKTLAIVGFIAAILFLVWLAVQVVGLIPSAFNSLASLADSVYNNKQETEEIVVANEKTVVSVGEAVTISWSEAPVDGHFVFSYDCIDGTAITIKVAGEVTDATCGSDVDLGQNTSAEIVMESEKQRFVDVPYTISFVPADDGDIMTTSSKLTAINATIPTTGVVENDDDKVVTTANTEATTPSLPYTGLTEDDVSVPAPAPTPAVTGEVVYAIPTSDPSGYVDLKVTLLGVGIITNDDLFVNTGVIGTDQAGAFQFEVHNQGTKTTSAWEYSAVLPNGSTYQSGTQVALKPNEKAIITIGFGDISQADIVSYNVVAVASGDIDLTNNTFTAAVNVVE